MDKKEFIISVTLRFKHEFTEEEIKNETEISHEAVVAGCIEKLVERDYVIDEEISYKIEEGGIQEEQPEE